MIQADYRQLVGKRPFPPDHHLVVFLGPPWGDALTASAGLDLGRTRPPVAEIVDDFERVYPNSP